MNKKVEEIQIPPQIKIQLQMRAYLDRAIDYYIFARKAVMLGVFPVGGNLFHIAVEMVLHCRLLTKYSQAELKKNFSQHELPYMWSEFKKTFTSSKLSTFDRFINHHRQWKDLRYPESNGRNIAIFFGPNKSDPEVMKKNVESLHNDNYIDINLEEMDEFINAIMVEMRINPNYIKIHIQRNGELTKIYLEKNLHPFFDSTAVVSPSSFLLTK